MGLWEMNLRTDFDDTAITPHEMPENIRGTRDAIFFLLRQHGCIDEETPSDGPGLPTQTTTPDAEPRPAHPPVPEAARVPSPSVHVQEHPTQYRFRLGKIRIPASAPRCEDHLPMDEFLPRDDEDEPGHFPGTPDRWTFG